MSFHGKKGPEGALGITAKTVDARTLRFRLQRVAARLLPGERVGSCLWSVISLRQTVDVVKEEGRRSHFTGLQTCGSVWHCPVCSQRISESRRKEVNTLFAWGRSEGLTPVLLTLTARHGRADPLTELLGALKHALKLLRQSRAWRALKGSLVGSVTATEVTTGASGWHPHFHIVLFFRGSSLAIAAALETLRPEWLRSLAKVGLHGNGHAFSWQDAKAAGNYVAKFGAAEELTLGSQKRGRAGSRTPVQLLEDADKGDQLAARLFREYAAAFKGRCQLSWSRGLKALVGVHDQEDTDLAKYSDAGELLASLTHHDWRALMRAGLSRSRILDVADSQGEEGLSAFLRQQRSRLGDARIGETAGAAFPISDRP